uniref:FLYWCH-type domain-containing protein n=1 Tax=Ditylenchus dipsaci TaxID=166011 RepID=A0A915EAC1_9BILA
MEFVQNALNAVPAPVVKPSFQRSIKTSQKSKRRIFVKSERGKDKAVHRGFQFQKHKTNKNGSTQYWQCVKYQTLNGGCKARLTTLTAGDVFSKLLPHDGNRLHNHALDPMAVPKSNIMANLKRRALDTRELPKELLNHELQTAPLALGPSLTDSATRNKIIRNYRKAHQIPVVEASNVQNLTFSDASKIIVLLGKERNIDWSVEMKITYWDGSFSITPAPFYQVYAILAERTSRDSNGGMGFPVMYALLMDKSAESYIKMMQMLKEVWPLFNPTTISMDFEQGAIQSALQLFPNAMMPDASFIW